MKIFSLHSSSLNTVVYIYEREFLRSVTITYLIIWIRLLTDLRKEGSSLGRTHGESMTRVISRYRACQPRDFLASSVCSSALGPSSPRTLLHLRRRPRDFLQDSHELSRPSSSWHQCSEHRFSTLYTLYVQSSTATRLRYYESPPRALSPCCIGCS